MRSVRRRLWFRRLILLALLSGGLMVWLQAAKGPLAGCSPEVRKATRDLQKRDCWMNALQLKVWNFLPGFTQRFARALQPLSAGETRLRASVRLQSLASG